MKYVIKKTFNSVKPSSIHPVFWYYGKNGCGAMSFDEEIIKCGYDTLRGAKIGLASHLKSKPYEEETGLIKVDFEIIECN